LSNPEKANFMTGQKQEFFTAMVSSLAEKKQYPCVISGSKWSARQRYSLFRL